MAILCDNFRDQTFAPLAGPNAKTLYGRLGQLTSAPLQISGLALKTYMGYWGIASIQSYARKDLDYGELSDEQLEVFAEKFPFITVKLLLAQPFSLLQRYFLGDWPYYFIVVISPLICALATWVSTLRAFVFLLFVHFQSSWW